MLEIKCQPYYDRVRAFAEKTGLLEQFEKQLEFLRKFADPKEEGLWKVVLTSDFAPASFALVWYKRREDGTYAFMMNGALIYHGDQQGWSQGERYIDPHAVRIAPSENPWSVHT